MATKRLPMRQIREILRLKHDQQLSHRAIASACRVGLGTVADYLGRAKQAGLEWPLPEDLDEAALEARLFPRAGPGSRERVAPDVERIHQELKRVGVTLHLLWEEYREANPKGYAYSQFCEIYRRWAQKLKPSMRQVHRAGEKTFIDFSASSPDACARRSCATRRHRWKTSTSNIVAVWTVPKSSPWAPAGGSKTGTIFSSPVRPASERVFWLRLSSNAPAGGVLTPPTSACLGSCTNWRSAVATAPTPESWPVWPKPICWPSTTGSWPRCATLNAGT